MKQSSDVQNRAEKEYKNSRCKFSFLLRETISNAFHAVIIRKMKENENYTPKISLRILLEEKSCIIELKDNGEGFNKLNNQYFEELDSKNPEKIANNFHPLGQGRLAIVYFTDYTSYETVYKDEEGLFHNKKFTYPCTQENLFSMELFQDEKSKETDTYTKLTMTINSQNSFSRAKTFFNKYPNIDDLYTWFIETFFPFIVSNDKIMVDVSFNGETKTISKKNLEKDLESFSFEVTINRTETADISKKFTLWLVNKKEGLHDDNIITCFARNLCAELINSKLAYSIDSEKGYLFYLTSDYFDENVDSQGERIEIESDISIAINNEITKILDEKFDDVIKENQKITNQNFNNFSKQFPSLNSFTNKDSLVKAKTIVKQEEILKKAVEEKGRIEKKFWLTKENDSENNKFIESKDCQKLLNSSLQIYVKHRERVLAKLHDLIQQFDPDGNNKPELESSVHELFFQRGNTLKDSSEINHLHNLWILDDKFTIFSNDFQAKSTKNGQPLSDIYIWADDEDKTKQILILELKSTTKAHNAGNNNEGMIAQVKRYAQDFYKDPRKVLNWGVDTNGVQYIGIILACKKDISKELTSNTVSGDFLKIPFLSNSYYKDEKFAINDDLMDKVSIRIELYSFEDIYQLASSRNEVFFKLLKKEFNVENE